MKKHSFLTKTKAFFKQKWVILSIQGIAVVAITIFFFATDIYEEKVLQLKGGYGKNKLILIILFKMHQNFGKTGSMVLILSIAAILFFLAFRSYKARHRKQNE